MDYRRISEQKLKKKINKNKLAVCLFGGFVFIFPF